MPSRITGLHDHLAVEEPVVLQQEGRLGSTAYMAVVDRFVVAQTNERQCQSLGNLGKQPTHPDCAGLVMGGDQKKPT